MYVEASGVGVAMICIDICIHSIDVELGGGFWTDSLCIDQQISILYASTDRKRPILATWKGHQILYLFRV